MPNQLNIISSLNGFLGEINMLMEQCHIQVGVSKGAHECYLTSEVFDEQKYSSVFDDGFADHAIEVRGGRSAGQELEMISFRIISKKPDSNIKSFFNKLHKFLKDSEQYGQGVGPGTSAYYKNIFFHKQEIQGKTLWFDLERKVVPIRIL